MASSKINTVQILDSRIEPQPNPTYAVTIGPDQNQWYHIEASGKTQNSISFNNLTTLGKDRAYLDTFELGLTVRVKFTTKVDPKITMSAGATKMPARGMFMPQSFPFNTVCDQVQVNINGGAFFSNPSQTIRAKERYWDEKKLHASYANVCPCSKPLIQNETGVREFTPAYMANYADVLLGARSRMVTDSHGYAATSTGPFGTTNFSIIDDYDPKSFNPNEKLEVAQTNEMVITWREPVMCSPFSSRYDATYGRPLYNITSIDLQFKMFGTLKNMFLCICPWAVDTWDVTLESAQLYYQVMTVTAPVPHDITIVPYRRFVPYITNNTNATAIDANGRGSDITMTSGVYTLNEVPTAIWVFAAPQLSEYQEISTHPQKGELTGYMINPDQSNTSNRLFGFMKKISISCGNTTQILDTAKPEDLYRIAKSNGCQDSFADWANPDPIEKVIKPKTVDVTVTTAGVDATYPTICWNPITEGGLVVPDYAPGAGSVLRLIPGVDIVLPEQRLIPGANANSLVFQVSATFDFDFAGNKSVPIALWVLFEYVGCAAIAPGNCQVTMNPLGGGGVMSSAPIVAASDLEPVSTTEGSGWLDVLKNVFSQVNSYAKETKIVSDLLQKIPKIGPALSSFAKSLGYGDTGMSDIGPDSATAAAATAVRPRGTKRPRETSGGAVMGLGDFC